MDQGTRRSRRGVALCHRPCARGRNRQHDRGPLYRPVRAPGRRMEDRQPRLRQRLGDQPPHDLGERRLLRGADDARMLRARGSRLRAVERVVTSAVLATPTHVAPERVVDIDIYALPGQSDDFHAAWRTLQDGAPPIVWTPRNEGHWRSEERRVGTECFSTCKYRGWPSS